MILGADGEPEKWERVEPYPDQDHYALCRCGRSRTMPFCDGTHPAVHFEGTETASHRNFAELAEQTTGPGVDLMDAACFCAIARYCHRAGDAWTHAEQSGEAASKRLAIEEAGACPSGRLVALEKATGTPIEPAFEPSLGLVEDTRHLVTGPIWVKGGVPIESAEGFLYERRNRVTLCRCGRSQNKPFCDGAHVRTRFKA